MYDSSLLVRAYRTCRILPGLFEPKPVFQAYLPVVVLHESITGNGRAVYNEVIFKNVKFKHKIFIYPILFLAISRQSQTTDISKSTFTNFSMISIHC